MGTVALTNNSTTVTGTGTNFAANVRVGDAFYYNKLTYEVTNVASATVLSISPAFVGANVSAQTYSIAPIQGYVKEAADRLRELTNVAGGVVDSNSVKALSTVTGSANKGLHFTSATTLATHDQSAQSRTFMAATTQAAQRTALGLASAATRNALGTTGELYGRDSVLGAVSQSGGVPTGALMEYGSNANGEYWRYAGGMQVCTNQNNAITTNPAAFVGTVTSVDANKLIIGRWF